MDVASDPSSEPTPRAVRVQTPLNMSDSEEVRLALEIGGGSGIRTHEGLHGTVRQHGSLMPGSRQTNRIVPSQIPRQPVPGYMSPVM
jgi:hypothetical protein